MAYGNVGLCRMPGRTTGIAGPLCFPERNHRDCGTFGFLRFQTTGISEPSHLPERNRWDLRTFVFAGAKPPGLRGHWFSAAPNHRDLRAFGFAQLQTAGIPMLAPSAEPQAGCSVPNVGVRPPEPFGPYSLGRLPHRLEHEDPRLACGLIGRRRVCGVPDAPDDPVKTNHPRRIRRPHSPAKPPRKPGRSLLHHEDVAVGVP